MTAEDKRAFWTLVKGVHSFYSQDVSEFAAQVWWNAMQGYSIDQVRRAFDKHAADPKSGQFMPKPADLIRVLDGTQDDRAALAWSKVLSAIQRVGAYATVVFDEGAIHAAIEDLGGWPKACATKFEELPFVEKRFCAAYRAHLKAGSAYPGKLPGIADQSNVAGGFGTQEPVLIGNPEQARQVLAVGAYTNGKAIPLSKASALIPEASVLHSAKQAGLPVAIPVNPTNVAPTC